MWSFLSSLISSGQLLLSSELSSASQSSNLHEPEYVTNPLLIRLHSLSPSLTPLSLSRSYSAPLAHKQQVAPLEPVRRKKQKPKPLALNDEKTSEFFGGLTPTMPS